MSLLPLTVIDCLRRVYSVCWTSEAEAAQAAALAERIIGMATLVDVIRWRSVSRAFRAAARKRLDSYTKIHIRVYDGLAELHQKTMYSKGIQWISSANVLICEMAPNTVGIAIDSKLSWKDAKVMVALTAIFRRSVDFVYMDSPIVELLLRHMNNIKVNSLLLFLSQKRRPSRVGLCYEEKCVVTPQRPHMPDGPFFPRLKQFTITCNKVQLSHLSRVVGYCVAVESLFEKQDVDLVCLQVILGDSWCRSKQRVFRHVSSFKQWLDASSLGVKYVQQFQGESNRRKRY